MTEQDSEVPTRFRVLWLLIQHMSSNGHQIRPLCGRRVIHRQIAAALNVPYVCVRACVYVHIYKYIMRFPVHSPSVIQGRLIPNCWHSKSVSEDQIVMDRSGLGLTRGRHWSICFITVPRLCLNFSSCCFYCFTTACDQCKEWDFKNQTQFIISIYLILFRQQKYIDTEFLEVNSYIIKKEISKFVFNQDLKMTENDGSGTGLNHRLCERNWCYWWLMRKIVNNFNLSSLHTLNISIYISLTLSQSEKMQQN